MELLFIIISTILLIILLGNFRKEVKKNMVIINKNVIHLKKEVEQLKKDTTVSSQSESKHTSVAPVPKALETQNLKIVAERNNPKTITPKQPLSPNTSPQKITQKKNETQQKTTQKHPITEQPKSPTVNTPKQKRDYEKLIGENWLNKIGIAVLVLGIGFFVKYAIDQNWIGLIGRVAIGFAAGATLIGIAHYLHQKYRSFSSVLIGGGVSIFYFTITIAYQQYHLFSQTSAFIALILVTLSTTLLALYYNRKELAIIALIGAFSSPFMVSNGTGNYSFLFTYIAIINLGMLVLSYYKKWRIVSQLALVFTTLFYGIWLVNETITESIKANLSLLFASIFFIQFIGMNMLYNLKQKINFTAWEFIQLTSITALYFGAVMYIMEQHQFTVSKGGFTLLFSLFFLLLTGIARSISETDKALINLLLGKTATFITLTGALIFSGDFVTIFWAIEGVVLLVIGRFGKMTVLKNAAIIVNAIALFGFARHLIGDFISPNNPNQFISPPFITGLFLMVGFGATLILLKKEKDKDLFLQIPTKTYRYIIGVSLFVIGYTSLFYELSHQIRHLEYSKGRHLIIWIFHFSIILLGIFIGRFKQSALIQKVFLFLGSIGLFLFVLLARDLLYGILNDIHIPNVSSNNFYYCHFILTGLVCAILFILERKKHVLLTNYYTTYLTALISIFALIVLTLELDLISGFVFKTDYDLTTIYKHTTTEGYTILWTVYSFILMLWGMRRNHQIIRITALGIFSITLIKLFAFDIREISEAGKIIAFILLGVLLLVISFMYQKLKELIVGTNDTANSEAEQHATTKNDK